MEIPRNVDVCVVMCLGLAFQKKDDYVKYFKLQKFI